MLILIIIFQHLISLSQNRENSKMTHILKNNHLEIHIDLPMAHYNYSRFDWTGKIVSVNYKGITISGVENRDSSSNNTIGRGFYNEFGIDRPVGFDEIEEGEFFHKIGIGLLKKEGKDYDFSRNYEIKPATFKVAYGMEMIQLECISQYANGYAYTLYKEIELLENGFIIRYHLKNTGDKTIKTDEYNHNFLAINKEVIGENYQLKFPFQLNQALFDANVNPDGKVDIQQQEVMFTGNPNDQFFFSNLTGNNTVKAGWELIHSDKRIGIRETGNFNTNKINLWGWQHVISPELFFDIHVEPGELVEWSRTYEIYKIP